MNTRWLGRFLLPGLLAGLCSCAALDRAISPKPAKRATAQSELLLTLERLSRRWDSEPIPVGLDPQVFFDDAVIAERSEGLQRRQGVAEKYAGGEPIITPDRPWEGKAVGVNFTVTTNDKGLFQMWYACGSLDYRGMYVGAYARLAYAESREGRAWTKPRGLPSLDNIVLQPAYGVGVWVDRHKGRKGAPYKAVYAAVGMRGVSQMYGLTFASSANGKRWRMYEDTEMLDEVRSDTHNSLLWDDELQQYRLYSRVMLPKGRATRLYVRPYVGPSPLGFLAQALVPLPMSTPWTQVADIAPPASGELYSMTVYKYGKLYVGNVALFAGDCIDFCLGLSRDGVNWDLQYCEPSRAVIPRGGTDSFDAGMLYPQAGAPLEQGEQWLLYYSGCWQTHSYHEPVRRFPYDWAIGLATIRREGFFYLENTGEQGRLVTKAFRLEGGVLQVNADTTAGEARIAVIVVDADGRERAWGQSRPIRMDGTRLRVEWPEGDLASLQGQIIRLRFDLKGSVRLYGFQVARG